jgi:GDSL-like Lipase/Acylhydrolase family
MSVKETIGRFIGLSFFYLVVVFLLLEGCLRVYYAVTDKVPPHFDYSLRKEWEWVKQRAVDGNASFNKEFEYDPWIGWNNRANIDTEKIKTNAQHMRNENEFSKEPKSGRRRLLIVGDSFSFGYGVSNAETFAYQLAGRMPDWDVMNMAVSATGTDQHVISFERYGKQFRPDIVVLGFYLLDYNRNTIRFRFYAKPMFQSDGDTLKLTNSPVPAPERLYDDYRSGKKTIGGWDYSYALAAIMQPIISHRVRDRSEGALGRRILAGLMRRFKAQVSAEGATPVWLILPDRGIVEQGLSKYEAIEAFSETLARELGMPVLNMDQLFRQFAKQHPDDPIWRPKEIGGHLSATGHRLVAEEIHRFFADNRLLQSDEGRVKREGVPPQQEP